MVVLLCAAGYMFYAVNFGSARLFRYSRWRLGSFSISSFHDGSGKAAFTGLPAQPDRLSAVVQPVKQHGDEDDAAHDADDQFNGRFR